MNVNRMFLSGHLTRDPETKVGENYSLAKFGIAVNRVSGSGDKKREEVLFIDCVAWGKPAELIAKHLKRGDPIFVEGRLQLDSWTTREGEKRQKIVAVVESFQFIPSGKRDGNDKPSPVAQEQELEF